MRVASELNPELKRRRRQGAGAQVWVREIVRRALCAVRTTKRGTMGTTFR